jgi:hypothetical protein
VDVPATVRDIARYPVGAVSEAAFDLKVLREVGLLGPLRPSKLARLLSTLARWGTAPAGVTALAAIREGDRVAVRDELGELSFEDLHRR